MLTHMEIHEIIFWGNPYCSIGVFIQFFNSISLNWDQTIKTFFLIGTFIIQPLPNIIIVLITYLWTRLMSSFDSEIKYRNIVGKNYSKLDLIHHNMFAMSLLLMLTFYNQCCDTYALYDFPFFEASHSSSTLFSVFKLDLSINHNWA